MRLAYGKTAYRRNRGGLPELPLVNLFVESTPVEREGVILQSRRALTLNTTQGDGPVRAVFQADGVLFEQRVIVSGYAVYVNAIHVGTITGDGPVSIAGDADEVLISAGELLYRWDGSTLEAVVFPDNAYVVKIIQLAGYFIALREGTHRWYFSAVGDGSSWNGLDYASAESEPDRLLDALVINDGMVLFGSESVEFWTRTGNADLPFSAIEQRVYNRGIVSTGCAVAVDNSFIWVGDDKIAYRGANVPEAISEDGVVERISGSGSHSAFVIEDERHKFVCIRLDDTTMVYDVTTGSWCEFASYGHDNFRARCAYRNLLGDDTDGRIWSFDGYTENEGSLERRFRAGLPMDGGTLRIANLKVHAQTGATTYLIGDYENPLIEMRFSDDLGKTWTDWMSDYLGSQGDYLAMPEWRALGVASYPGRLFEFRVTDPVPLRISGVTANEAKGGPARA